MQRHPVETKRRMTTSSSTNKKQRTTAPSSSEQREASKFWNGFTQQLSDQTWLPTTDDALVQTDCSENTWFTATWKSKHDSTKNPHKVSHHAQHCRSEEHTSELQSLVRISYAVFCLKKKKHYNKVRQSTISNTSKYHLTPNTTTQ